MVETVSQAQFNFSSDYTPYTFASTMRTCYANNKTPSDDSGVASLSSSSSNNSKLNLPNLKSSLDRRSSCNEVYLRNSDHHNCKITTTCVNSNCASNKANVKPKLRLTTTTFENAENNCVSSCTTQLSTPQSNGMISQKHQFSVDQQHLVGQQPISQFSNRMSTSSTPKQKRSESLGFNRQNSELNDDNNNNLLTSSFDDNHENSNSSEDDLVFNELSSSPSSQNHHLQTKSQRQMGTFALCKKSNSNSSLTSFSSISSSVSSNNNLNQFTLTNCPQQPFNQDNLINNLSHSLNQTFTSNNLSTPQFGRSRHNSINSLTLSNNSQTSLHALHKALHNIFSN